MSRQQNAVLGSAIMLVCACLLSCGIVERARQERREADVIQRLRDIRAAESTFRARHGRFGRVADLVGDGLLVALSTGDDAGFRFEFSADASGYAIAAVPAKRDDRYQYVGQSFFLDASGVIRGTPYGKANGYRNAGRADEPIPRQ